MHSYQPLESTRYCKRKSHTIFWFHDAPYDRFVFLLRQYPIFFNVEHTDSLHGIYWAKHKTNGVPTPKEQKCWDHSKEHSILRRRSRFTRRWSGWRGGTPWWQLTWAPIVSLITTSWFSQPPSPEQIADPLHSGHQLRQQLLQLVVNLALPDKISSSL